MKQSVASFVVGFLFALGLGIAGMTQPQKVIGFLDITAWDPSLMFVMVGAISVHGLAYLFISRQKKPLLDDQFHLPKKREITTSLVMGSVIFGVGWGIAGFCPGPAVVSLASGQSSAVVFVATMILGMLLVRLFAKFLPSSR